MRKTLRSRRSLTIISALAVAAAALFVAAGYASQSPGPQLSDIPTPNLKAAGFAPAAKLSEEIQQVVLAQGSTALENPRGIYTHYGYENDVPSADDPSVPQMLPTTTGPTEAVKTEPDKNTYLVFKNGLSGGDPTYDYGTHFLFQGHEGAAKDSTPAKNPLGYITRINLDADAAHRVTLLATKDTSGKPLPTIDGSTWEPWAKRVLFTAERGNIGGVWAATPDAPSTVEDVSGALGRGGYEAIQDDSSGNLWIVEDVGGAVKAGSTAAKQPNSFVYRYVPTEPGDLKSGKLQALQVLSGNHPITFETEGTFPSQDQIALHTYGKVFTTEWVTIHEGFTAGGFDANAAAKAAHATPFKRPENGQFRPGSNFREFFFDETGDTNATSSENDTAGGWGSIMKLTQSSPSSNTGTLTMFYKSDEAHSSFDNVAFLSRQAVSFVEDAGDTLHAQRKALDSGYVFDVTQDYSGGAKPVRWLAQGRDPSATVDAANGGFGKNDQDNEITGIHVSDGDPGVDGILGAKVPRLFSDDKWRWVYTQQHGDNPTYEVLAKPGFAGQD